MPKDLSAVEQYEVDAGLEGMAAATPASEYRVGKVCSPDVGGSDAMRSNCAELAEHLVAAGPSLLDFALGIQLGKTVGWSARRIDDLTKQWEILDRLPLIDGSDMSTDFLTCAAASKLDKRLLDISTQGELNFLRRELEVTGLPKEEVSAQEDEEQARFKARMRAIELYVRKGHSRSQ
jgi:hypothetical protein